MRKHDNNVQGQHIIVVVLAKVLLELSFDHGLQLLATLSGLVYHASASLQAMSTAE